jgi:hypothetical protein
MKDIAIPTKSIDHFAKTGSYFSICHHKDKEPRKCRKKPFGEEVSQSGFTACKFLWVSKGRPVCNTLKMITSILRVMAGVVFKFNLEGYS